MNYTLLIYYDEGALTRRPQDEQSAIFAAFMAYSKALQDAGAFIAADWLKGTAAATTLTCRTGTRQVQDGPFAETKEQLGGYFVIRAAHLDEALAWAEKCPVVTFGSVEIRPSMMG